MKHARGVIGALVLALGLFAPSRAMAEPEAKHGSERPFDTVDLKSGESIRGRVTELVPDDHVTILVNGEELALTWWEIERVDLAGTPRPPPPPPRPLPAASLSSTTSASEPPMEGPLALVHLESKRPLVLYRRPADATAFVKACDSPCDLELPLGDTYEIGGPGTTTTKEFKLEGKPGQRIELSIDGTSWFGVVAGAAVTIAGGISGYVGVLSLLSDGVNRSNGMREAGLGASVLGAALMGTGFYIALRSMETDLAQKTPRRAKEAFLRTPTWRTPAETASFPRVSSPLFFEGTF
jgi:hypothetical protein